MDNRGGFFKFIFSIVNITRKYLSKIRNEGVRSILVKFLMIFFISSTNIFCKVFKFFGFKTSKIPLNYYANNFSLKRIEQDVYDRFFTHIKKGYQKKKY